MMQYEKLLDFFSLQFLNSSRWLEKVHHSLSVDTISAKLEHMFVGSGGGS